jgi:hypothetical protein
MATARRHCTRRGFLGAAAASTVVATLGRSRRACAEGPDKLRDRKTILSFYCDDTGPHVAGAKAFEIFLDYCARQGIAGESSAILGMSGHSISRNPNDEEKAFLKQVGRARECGIDTHMELMTHQGLFDFDADRSGRAPSTGGCGCTSLESPWKSTSTTSPVSLRRGSALPCGSRD